MPLETGARLGHYEVVSPIGAGGMGEVYKARDLRLNRTVAIKVLPAHITERAELRERFEREARAIAAITSSISRQATRPKRRASTSEHSIPKRPDTLSRAPRWRSSPRPTCCFSCAAARC